MPPGNDLCSTLTPLLATAKSYRARRNWQKLFNKIREQRVMKMIGVKREFTTMLQKFKVKIHGNFCMIITCEGSWMGWK